MCASPEANHACGRCRNCVLIDAGTHPDFFEETFELNDKGEPRKEILIAQIRRLSEKLVLTPQIASGEFNSIIQRESQQVPALRSREHLWD